MEGGSGESPRPSPAAQAMVAAGKTGGAPPKSRVSFQDMSGMTEQKTEMEINGVYMDDGEEMLADDEESVYDGMPLMMSNSLAQLNSFLPEVCSQVSASSVKNFVACRAVNDDPEGDLEGAPLLEEDSMTAVTPETTDSDPFSNGSGVSRQSRGQGGKRVMFSHLSRGS